MSYQKKIDPRVQAFYDGLNDEERVVFDQRLVAAQKKLCDMRWAKSTDKLDQRLLIPRTAKVKNYDWHRKLKEGEGDDTPETPETPPEKPTKPAAKIPEGKDLAGYIKDSLGDGKVLADFYLELLNLTTKEARKRGVFMNHKLMAAAWLGERGWGKAKGEEADKGITINLINHADVNTPERPPIATAAIEASVETVDNDAGRDVDVTIAETEQKQNDDVVDIDVDTNFTLRE